MDVMEAESNWVVGDEIAIASTSFKFDEAEKKKITSIGANAEGKLKVGLDSALKYEHLGERKMYGSREVKMQAEVGLLSRNVRILGDESSSVQTEYGGHILVKGNYVEARIKDVEMYHMGQAYQVGRHPVSFVEAEHLGASYVAQTSIWDGFNRAIALSASNCAKIERNVAFRVMGHNFFLRDGVERDNTFEGNLAVATRASHSLLNTDQTPAAFWVPSPRNHFKSNHAAGAEMYGFWLDPPPHPTGQSASEAICPPGEQLGSFDGNVAHSTGRYGLRLFSEHTPRKFPCKPISVEPT